MRQNRLQCAPDFGLPVVLFARGMCSGRLMCRQCGCFRWGSTASRPLSQSHPCPFVHAYSVRRLDSDDDPVDRPSAPHVKPIAPANHLPGVLYHKNQWRQNRLRYMWDLRLSWRYFHRIYVLFYPGLCLYWRHVPPVVGCIWYNGN